jgi:hypothetical protein
VGIGGKRGCARRELMGRGEGGNLGDRRLGDGGGLSLRDGRSPLFSTRAHGDVHHMLSTIVTHLIRVSDLAWIAERMGIAERRDPRKLPGFLAIDQLMRASTGIAYRNMYDWSNLVSYS